MDSEERRNHMALTIDNSITTISMAAASQRTSQQNTASQSQQAPKDSLSSLSDFDQFIPHEAPQSSRLSAKQAPIQAPVKNAKGQVSAVDLSQLQNALQKSGINAEIEYKPNGKFIFRYVDEQTHRVEFQIPSEVVVALVASLNEASNSKQTALRGAFIDQRA
jgi:uncharacterized FlaG/YvyC family protein